MSSSLLDHPPEALAIAARTTPSVVATYILANASTVHVVLTIIAAILTIFFLIMQIIHSYRKDQRAQLAAERSIKAHELMAQRASRHHAEPAEEEDE